MMYLLSDFFRLWHAMQFCTRIGATSLRKLTGAGSSATAGLAIPRESRNVARIDRARFIAGGRRRGAGSSIRDLGGWGGEADPAGALSVGCASPSDRTGEPVVLPAPARA